MQVLLRHNGTDLYVKYEGNGIYILTMKNEKDDSECKFKVDRKLLEIIMNFLSSDK